MSFLLEWLTQNPTAMWWLAGLSAATFVGTLAAIPIVVVRMERDYFLYREPPPDSWRGRHRIVRVTLRALKNLLGFSLVAAGLVLSLPLIPGQGILTILIGVSLLDFPGKRAIELRLARQRPVLGAINWMREKAGRQPLLLPEAAGRPDS